MPNRIDDGALTWCTPTMPYDARIYDELAAALYRRSAFVNWAASELVPEYAPGAEYSVAGAAVGGYLTGFRFFGLEIRAHTSEIIGFFLLVLQGQIMTLQERNWWCNADDSKPYTGPKLTEPVMTVTVGKTYQECVNVWWPVISACRTVLDALRYKILPTPRNGIIAYPPTTSNNLEAHIKQRQYNIVPCTEHTVILSNYNVISAKLANPGCMSYKISGYSARPTFEPGFNPSIRSENTTQGTMIGGQRRAAAISGTSLPASTYIWYYGDDTILHRGWQVIPDGPEPIDIYGLHPDLEQPCRPICDGCAITVGLPQNGLIFRQVHDVYSYDQDSTLTIDKPQIAVYMPISDPGRVSAVSTEIALTVRRTIKANGTTVLNETCQFKFAHYLPTAEIYDSGFTQFSMTIYSGQLIQIVEEYTLEGAPTNPDSYAVMPAPDSLVASPEYGWNWNATEAQRYWRMSSWYADLINVGTGKIHVTFT